MNYKPQNYNGTFLVIAIILTIIVFLVQSCESSNIYNNGICPYCGGNFVFKETVGHRYSTHYIYVCDKCGNLIESSTYFNKGE